MRNGGVNDSKKVLACIVLAVHGLGSIPQELCPEESELEHGCRMSFVKSVNVS